MTKNSVRLLEVICFRDSQTVLDLIAAQTSSPSISSNPDLLMGTIKFQDKAHMSFDHTPLTQRIDERSTQCS